MTWPYDTWERHRCSECSGAAYLYTERPGKGGSVVKRVLVRHRPWCESRPGGRRWNAAVDRLRTLTQRQPIG